MHSRTRRLLAVSIATAAVLGAIAAQEAPAFALNPQPLPPRMALNPQALPPSEALNPQPLPPGGEA
jgi:hypothetical protein